MISQLPDAVKNNLPGHEQEIYTQAFKSAERKYEKNENGNGVEGCRLQPREHELLTGRLIVGGTRGVSSPKFLPDS